ncbi:MAG TPA: LptF/LptG family permease [Gemmatimonadales bacterium]|nr:LptF/LptG family permease [Gemmatimonadales bacterium]
MRLLARYLLRQLFAPFCFSLAAATSLMLLNQIAKRFGALVGKGLPWSVISEVFVLSLPFILAMTIPMAVLLAVLYAFSHLAADNEVMALRATGVSVPQMLRPILGWGVVMSVLTFLFIDQVLPNSNAQLRALLIDIGRKKPTFELREQVINEVPPSKYFLRSSRIDGATGLLRGVTIYDVGDENVRRIIYADSGFMAYAPGGKDLTLRLFDGVVHQYKSDEADRFQVTRFATNEIRVRNVFDELERNTSDQIRGDRELSSCAMLAVVRDADRDQAKANADRRFFVERDLHELLALPALQPDTTSPEPPDDYCVWLQRLRTEVRNRLAPAKLAAQAPDSHPTPRAKVKAPATQQPSPTKSTTPSRVVKKPAPAVSAGSSSTAPLAAKPSHPPVRLSSRAEVSLALDRAKDADLRADRYMVEVHKKWAISMACISFVLIGMAMALRFPRGGMGLVIGGGLAVFSLYYVGLTAGEALADRGLLSPGLSMWLPNIILTVVGVLSLIRVNQQPGLNRGGDFRELLDGFRYRLRWRRRSA